MFLGLDGKNIFLDDEDGDDDLYGGAGNDLIAVDLDDVMADACESANDLDILLAHTHLLDEDN